MVIGTFIGVTPFNMKTDYIDANKIEAVSIEELVYKIIELSEDNLVIAPATLIVSQEFRERYNDLITCIIPSERLLAKWTKRCYRLYKLTGRKEYKYASSFLGREEELYILYGEVTNKSDCLVYINSQFLKMDKLVSLGITRTKDVRESRDKW